MIIIEWVQDGLYVPAMYLCFLWACLRTITLSLRAIEHVSWFIREDLCPSRLPRSHWQQRQFSNTEVDGTSMCGLLCQWDSWFGIDLSRWWQDHCFARESMMLADAIRFAGERHDAFPTSQLGVSHLDKILDRILTESIGQHCLQSSLPTRLDPRGHLFWYLAGITQNGFDVWRSLIRWCMRTYAQSIVYY